MPFKNLKALREDNDIKQKDIAAYLNVSQNTYSQYETGIISLTAEVLIKLADLVDNSEEEPLYEESEYLSHVLYKFQEEKPFDIKKENNEYIKCAKDVAAGAVVITAITAICVGIALFGDVKRIADTLTYIFTHSESIIIFLCLFIIDIVILFWKGKKL